MAVADHILIPLRPKRRDLKTVPHMEDILSTCKMVNPKMNAAFVITQCPSLPSLANRILEAKEVCRSFGIPVLNSVTFSRNMYDDSEESGQSVIESEPEGKAATEIRTLFEELLAGKVEDAYEFTQPQKSKPLAKPNRRTVEDFIDDALLYAQGKVDKKQPSAAKNDLKDVRTDRVVPIRKPAKSEGMRHATFTLTPQCIEKLANIAQKTGKAKSALIREWIENNTIN